MKNYIINMTIRRDDLILITEALNMYSDKVPIMTAREYSLKLRNILIEVIKQLDIVYKENNEG